AGLGIRLERLDALELEQVGEVLNRDVEDVGEQAQLVERRVADTAFVTGQLRVVDLPAFGPRLFLDSSQRESVPRAQPAEVVSQPLTASDIPFRLHRLSPRRAEIAGTAPNGTARDVAPGLRVGKGALMTGPCQEAIVIRSRAGCSTPVAAAPGP